MKAAACWPSALQEPPSRPSNCSTCPPPLFVENQGQWADDSVRYALFGNGANVLHTDTGLVFRLVGRDSVDDLDYLAGDSVADLFDDPYQLSITSSTLEPISSSQTPIGSATESPPTIVFSVGFEGAAAIEPVGWDRAETYHNYFIGEQENWRSNVPTFETVAYPGLYDGIDLLTWGRRESLKYEFHVAPGADYKQIRVRYQGIESLSLDEDGTLRVETAVGTLFDAAPYIYQELGGQQVEVAGNFTLLDEQTYTFTISGPYDAGAELVIDPELDWSTYLGRSGEEIGLDIAVDGDGNVLATGWTESSDWISGGFDTTHNRGADAYVVKFSPSGSHLWSTYLGGSSEDVGSGIAVDAAGNVLVTGGTFSPDWAVSGGFDLRYHGRSDGFVVKLSPSGDHVWSTYLGGSLGDAGSAIAVDTAGNALVSGSTDSSFWVTGGFETTHDGGGSDGFVVKLSSAGEHLWSTYLGGSQADVGTDIAVDTAGSALVTGLTKSAGWVSGGFDTTYNGQADVFVAKLSPGGSHVSSTYLGGNEEDSGQGISVDPAGAALVTGLTESPGWVSGGYDTTFNGGEGSRDGFVARLSSIDPLPADLTGDGFVDFEDLTLLLAAWNQNVSALEGNLVDAAGSPVNFADLTVLLAAWTGPGPAGAPVGRRLAAAVGGDWVGDVGGSGESVAVGDASYRRGDEAPRQAGGLRAAAPSSSRGR